MTQIDPKALRNAFGAFMTGVTVVTSDDANGQPIGFTANSFTSVSLEPALLLVCLAKSSSNLEAFSNAKHFAVNILAEDQQDVSNTFARPVDDRFAAVSWQRGPYGAPLIDGVSAWFDCSVHEVVDAGDHVILIGQVQAFADQDRDGLGYARGGYFTRALEAQGAAALAAEGKTHVSAVIERDGALLLVKDEQGARLPTAQGAEAASGQDAIARLQAATGLTLGEHFIYSVYEDAEQGSQHIVYRCHAEAGEAKQGAFEPLSQVSAEGFSDAAEQTVIQRFIQESALGNFGVYVGDRHSGRVSPMGAAE